MRRLQIPRDVIEQAYSMGLAVARGRSVLPDLALYCAAQTLQGKITARHAHGIYCAYYDPLAKAGFPISERSLAAQVSKLRQIILLVECHGRKGITVLKRAVKAHTDITLACQRDRTLKPAYDLYGYMVFCARVALHAHNAQEFSKAVEYRSRLLKAIRAQAAKL